MVYSYGCNKCKRKFTRKWNAFRHNENVHSGLATIFNNQTGIISNNTDYTDKRISAIDPPDEYSKESQIEQRVMEIYGKMIKPVEDLEKIYWNNPEPQRNRFLSDSIIMALMSSDPVKSLYDTINFTRSVLGKIKIVQYVSKNLQMNPVQAEGYLTDLIKTGYYFETNVRLNMKKR